MPTNINGVRGVQSYTLFRHDGAGSPDGILALGPAYGAALIFKDDVAAGETPPRVYPQTGGFTSRGMVLSNDAGASIFFSLDGIRDHGVVFAGETLQIDWIHAQRIFLRGAAGGEAYRLWVW